MNVEQLKLILQEYPMSRPVKIVVEKKVMLETTVVQLLMKLIDVPPNGWLAFCGRHDVILRERIDSSGGDAIIPPGRTWLEMDMR